MAAKDNEWRVLRAVNDSDVPVGAIYLSGELGIPPANIGRTLIRLENRGMVAKVQNKGRTITESGKKYLEGETLKNTKFSIADELIHSAVAGDEKNLLEILQVRKLLESYTARCCAQAVTAELVRELEDIQFDYVYELRHRRSGSGQDLNLHLKIAECSGNYTIARILKLLLTDRDSYAKFTKAALSHNQLRQDEHEAILAAIREGNADRAASEMECHLERVIQNVEYYYAHLDKHI